jgi:hypothetical protein
MKAAALALLAALTLTACGEHQLTEVDRYTDTCHERGGFVSRKPNSWSVDYACVGQTTGASIPPMTQ